MTKWEYCAINTEAGLKYFQAEGNHSVEKYTEKNIDNVHRNIAKLGNEGWELVTHGPIASGASVYYFKRPQGNT